MLQQIISAKIKRSVKDALLFAYPKVKVKVNQGTIKGCVEKLPNGNNFLRFSGIPYAQSPIGELRFKSPRKLMKFESDELDCTRERSACFHRSPVTRGFIGAEKDCLNLNVYVPADVDTKKLPVLFFIHGGGFMFDSNSVDFYSPEYLLMEDVIVVTINYRLHALGFASLPNMGISGNAGLKDQQLALEWVYENIANFNGDPENICLFGESAGGASVYLQTLSSKSRKYIKSAICQSGTALDAWIIQRDGVEKTRTLAKLIGARSNNDSDFYETLMNANPQLLYENCFATRNKDEHRRTIPFMFKPVVERESDDAFMTKTPLELIKSQEGLIDLPMLFGTNSSDGMTASNYFRKNLDSYNEDKVRLVPLTVDIDPMSDEAKALGQKIFDFYLGEKGACNENMEKFIDLITDIYFFIPQVIHARLNQIHHPALTQYLYEFDFDEKLNFFKKALNMAGYKGACHFDDISYLYRHQIIDVSVQEDSREHQMRKRMCKLWANFAKYGNPTPHNNNPLSIKWDAVKSTDNDLNYLLLIDNPRMTTNIYSDRVNFWKEIFEKYNGSFLNPKC